MSAQPAFDLPEVQLPHIPPAEFHLRAYGAKGDGQLCTDAFNAAITDCWQHGGGRVIVPAGCYLTGPVRLRSRVELHLERGAYVLFSRNYDDYPLISTYYEGLKLADRTSYSAEISARYARSLFRRRGYHAYQDAQGLFQARLLRVEGDGRFVLEDEQGQERSYLFKEVQYVI